MSIAAFDTLNSARALEAAGFERAQVEAITSAIGCTGERAATKADLEPLATKANRSALETRLTNRSCGTTFVLAGIIIAGVKLL